MFGLVCVGRGGGGGWAPHGAITRVLEQSNYYTYTGALLVVLAGVIEQG
jgi:hypothetical protein